MSTALFLLVLVITIQITNLKNSTKASEDVLEFSRKDSFIIFICFISSFFVNFLSREFFRENYWLSIGISGFIYTMILIILNMSRERMIKKKHEEVLKIFQSLTDILGKIDPSDIDLVKLPFEYEIDPKMEVVNKIVLDTSLQGGRFNETTITLAQYSINKFFPELQWISKADYPKRELIFKGLPKPPRIAKYPGSDYRPTAWIPLGLSGEGEVGWNMGDPKDLGSSSYISEDGKIPDSIQMPSAPQCLTLGSTGGGKAIFIDQIVDIL